MLNPKSSLGSCQSILIIILFSVPLCTFFISKINKEVNN